MGEELWKTAATWPPHGSEPQRWYFASGGALLRDAPTADDAADRYAIDFQATTGTKNRWMTNNTGDDVVYGDRETADRRLLTYTSAPLAQDVEITGQPVVALHVSSTHTDGAFVVNVEDVAPDGYVRYLTGGQLRAIHRKISAEEPPYTVLGPYHSFKRKDGSPLVPGEITEIPFELMPVSVVVRAGHRLRVAIAGADADTFRRIPEEGVPIITVYRDATHASYIALPVAGR
jgi:putative CocE/NonD family hydrolase